MKRDAKILHTISKLNAAASKKVYTLDQIYILELQMRFHIQKVLYHINKMIKSTRPTKQTQEKAFDRTQHPFKIKIETRNIRQLPQPK